MESPLAPQRISHFQVPSPHTPIQTTRRPDDLCFRCRQPGHWSRHWPFKQSRSPIAPPNSTIANIYCRCGHGFCEVREAKNDRNCGRSYYVCPIKRGKKCKDFVQWCEDPIDESYLRPPQYTYPTCSCGAGVCRRVKATSGPHKGRYFFACPIKQGHGACSHCVWEDTLSAIPNVEDLLDPDMTIGDLQDMDISPNIDDPLEPDIVPNTSDPQNMDIAPNTGYPQDTDISPNIDIDDSLDIDMTISVSWEFLEENARSMLRQRIPSTTGNDLSPEKHIQHHEEEKVRLAYTPDSDNSVRPEEHIQCYEEEEVRLGSIHNSHVKAKAEFEASQKRSQLLREKADQLKMKLQELKGEIISCELEAKEIQTRLDEMEASMMDC
ncbi:uncharacterized protein LOC129320323 [Prosopis cineraria]|uniref:uncharacterized protein LOC129320323 n=1 Tax=Prosopis cineraria TaxID=364024 RepID=UPI00240ED5D2|nr:uncharacterized protein LOC129320323 [Prosopis cineraria]